MNLYSYVPASNGIVACQTVVDPTCVIGVHEPHHPLKVPLTSGMA